MLKATATLKPLIFFCFSFYGPLMNVIKAAQKMSRNPEFGKVLLEESGILGFGIRNAAQGIRNSAKKLIGIRSSSSNDHESGF